MVNKVVLAIFGILVIFIAGIFVIGYFVSKEANKEIIPQPAEEKTTEEIIFELCSKYKNLEAITTCEQAANLVLSKYQGEIFSIENKQINMPLPQIQGEKKISETTDVWLITIQLKNPIKLLSLEIPIKLASQPEAETDKLEITINTNSGAIFSLKPLNITIPK